MDTLYIKKKYRYNKKAMKDTRNGNGVHSKEIEEETTETFTELELEDIEEEEKNVIKKIKEKLKTCEQEKAAHLESLQRTKAEFLNSKRRLEQERLTDKQRATTVQIEKLLPLCDSFHMAMSNRKVWEQVDVQWRNGVESIYNQLQNILDSYGVKEFSPQGEIFNPSVHEAMSEVPVDDKDMDHKVITVIQNGFTRTIDGRDELVRPARVTVGIFSH